MGELEKYLKKIAGKEKRLVDNGTGSVISMNPSVDFAGDNLIIITRKKESTTNNTRTQKIMLQKIAHLLHCNICYI